MSDDDLPNRALKKAIAQLGSQAAFAGLVGVRQPAVSKWLARGAPLPAEFVLKVEAETGISRHDLRPDVYPLEDQPAALRPGSIEAAR